MTTDKQPCCEICCNIMEPTLLRDVTYRFTNTTHIHTGEMCTDCIDSSPADIVFLHVAPYTGRMKK